MLDLNNPTHIELLVKAGVPQSKIDSMHNKQKAGGKLANWIKIETPEGNKLIRMPESPEEIEERKKIHEQITKSKKLRKDQRLEEEFQLDEFSEMAEEKKVKAEFFKSIKESIHIRTACWIWIGNPSDYGRIEKEAYKLFKKQLDEDSKIAHKCENTKCINPNHLYQIKSE